VQVGAKRIQQITSSCMRCSVSSVRREPRSAACSTSSAAETCLRANNMKRHTEVTQKPRSAQVKWATVIWEWRSSMRNMSPDCAVGWVPACSLCTRLC